MEIDKEKLAEQAGQLKEQAAQLKEQAAEMMSKVDVKKATGVADAFMNKVFFFGKLFSALLVPVCAVVMAGAFLCCLFSGGGAVEVPTFDAAEAAGLAANGDQRMPNLAPLWEKNAVEKKYKSKIKTLLEVGKLEHNTDYNTILELMCKIKRDMRPDFIDGAIKYVQKSKKWHQEHAQTFDGADVFVKYSEKFMDAADKAEAEGLVAKERKASALAIGGNACLGFVLFLMIPLLVRIEENTRK